MLFKPVYSQESMTVYRVSLSYLRPVCLLKLLYVYFIYLIMYNTIILYYCIHKQLLAYSGNVFASYKWG